MPHRLYVVRLDPAVLNNRRFVERNPDYVPGKPCVYVGRTSLTPEERFQKHKDGIKRNPFVQKYGLYLMKRAYKNCPPQEYPKILEAEKALAERLQRKGYAVWYG